MNILETRDWKSIDVEVTFRAKKPPELRCKLTSLSGRTRGDVIGRADAISSRKNYVRQM